MAAEMVKLVVHAAIDAIASMRPRRMAAEIRLVRQSRAETRRLQ